MISKTKIFFYILLVIILITIIYFVLYKKYDTFEIPQTTKISYNDGTQLYGSIFLDSLNEVVINMTDPPIKYDKKRIELVRYSDILL
jgi:hypothetical protein